MSRNRKNVPSAVDRRLAQEETNQIELKNPCCLQEPSESSEELSHSFAAFQARRYERLLRFLWGKKKGRDL